MFMDKTILRNQARGGRRPARTWFNYWKTHFALSKTVSVCQRFKISLNKTDGSAGDLIQVYNCELNPRFRVSTAACVTT